MESSGYLVTGQERKDRQARLVFNRSNLTQLKDAVVAIFDIFYDILEKDFQYGSYFTHKDILKRLEDVENIQWSNVRMKFIEDDVNGYLHGQYKDNELHEPAKLILDFIHALDKCKKGINDKIEEKHKDVKKAEEASRESKDQANKAYKILLEERQKVNWQLQEGARNSGKLQPLEQLIQEKTDKIAEFQRCNNVVMWEKEKDKVLAEANKIIESLKNQQESMQNEKLTLSRKISDMENQVRLLRLKQEKTGPVDSEISGEMEKVKRDSFLKDKDITHLETEVYNQQKLFVGMLGGLRTDINMLNEKFYDKETHARDPEFVKILSRIDKVYNGAAENTLPQVKNMLPPHYSFFDTELRMKRTRRLSIAKTNSLADMSHLPPLNSISSVNGDLNKSVKSPESPSLPTLDENPVIVNPKSDKINGMVYLKHFPHMSQQFIMEHWTNFKKFDKNGDKSLDLSEVVKLLSILGADYTPDQLKEAMDEVDLDHSQSLDFYEYLLVVDKVMKKTGKAMIFKKGLSKQNNTMVSKTCAVM